MRLSGPSISPGVLSPIAPILQANGGVAFGSEEHGKRQQQSQANASVSIPEMTKQNFVPTIEDIAEEELSRTALTEFYQRGINGESPWFTYEKDHWIRVAYIGAAMSNLTHLVQGELSTNSNHAPSLHLPFPSIRPIMPWKPQKDQPIVRWYSKMAEDTGALPAKEIRDDLIEAFFEKIHPGFPIIDEAQFRSQYADPENPPPLLLLQSILLVGAHVCQHYKVAESRALVKMALFRRAKALFEMRFENDRMHLVQAALLFTWHFEGPDDASSNAYYWVGVACRIAFGLGMHRDLGPSTSTRMPAGDTRIYRRIWWTLVQTDVLASLHHGRPPMIDPDECDQSPLLSEDFIEYCGRKNQNVNIHYNIQNSNLCSIILQIIKFSSPGSLRRCNMTQGVFEKQQKSLDAQLLKWYLGLPPDVSKTTMRIPNFWTLQLHLHYNLALIHLHRIPSERSTPQSTSQSSDTCHTAALSIARLIEEIVSTKFVDRCSFTALTSLFSAAIQISSEARSATNKGEVILAIQAQSRLAALFPSIEAISKYWPSATAIATIFRDLLVKLEDQSKAVYERIQSAEISIPVSDSSDTREAPSLNLTTGHGNGNGDWSNFFEMGESNPFADIEALGLESWLTMPTSGNRFAE
ncbi:fungal specific transcription factor domain-containing protein [Phlyctema vagabunda]|uniref:Fungal specific transcription factor domain-containing protein n=1 Tax=Phlyctema vagabunda TaxID=108571 RepID=A0ABR4PPY6_9HELO